MKILNKLERRFGRYAIDNLMLIVCGGQILVYIADLMTGGGLSDLLWLNWAMVMKGEVWRCLTFVFVPTGGSLLSTILSVYLYFMIGGALENEWGTFNFNCYYYLGMICCIVSAAISGYSTSTYINQAMFFAFAFLYPDYQLLLFYVVPVKVKWIALFDLLIYVTEFITVPSYRWTIILSLVPVALFFWDAGIAAGRRALFVIRNRIKYRNTWK